MQGKVTEQEKKPASGGRMYKKRDGQMTVEDYILPFSGELDGNNRWVKLSKMIPWEAFEEKYARLFGKVGNPAKPARMALGALLIQTKLQATDEETVAQISENVYLQYFVGMQEYQSKPPFDPSMMVYFRKRITSEMLEEINEWIRKKEDGGEANGSANGGELTDTVVKDTSAMPKENRGQLMLDATCAPQDIRYPTDVSLLNDAREQLERMIDTLWSGWNGGGKPRTYRECARREYLRFVKDRKPRIKKIRRAIRLQLGYIGRDLKIVDELLSGSNGLSTSQSERLRTIVRLYEQQLTMYKSRTHRVEERIVSISQPHVRPIVRGKAGREVEFGAKVLVSLVDGHAAIEKLSWENFHEGGELINSVERYHEKYGFYPEAVLADKLFRSRENRAYCKTRGIRLSGPPLGRPKRVFDAERKRQERLDSAQRNAIEGVFGRGKRRFGLDLIMTKLKETSVISIHLQFLVMNLENRIRFILSRFFCRLVFAT